MTTLLSLFLFVALSFYVVTAYHYDLITRSHTDEPNA
jgi:hypothetical protein